MSTEKKQDISGKILTIREIAKFLGVGERTIYRLAKEGKMPAFKFGGQWRFDRDVIQQWVAEETNKNLLRE